MPGGCKCSWFFKTFLVDTITYFTQGISKKKESFRTIDVCCSHCYSDCKLCHHYGIYVGVNGKLSWWVSTSNVQQSVYGPTRWYDARLMFWVKLTTALQYMFTYPTLRHRRGPRSFSTVIHHLLFRSYPHQQQETGFTTRQKVSLRMILQRLRPSLISLLSPRWSSSRLDDGSWWAACRVSRDGS